MFFDPCVEPDCWKAMFSELLDFSAAFGCVAVVGNISWEVE